jgi:hypothetical protein
MGLKDLSKALLPVEELLKEEKSAGSVTNVTFTVYVLIISN